MDMITKLILIAGILTLIVFFAIRLAKTYYNIKALRDPRNLYDITKQREGMVYNKDTEQLEADQSFILPFE